MLNSGYLLNKHHYTNIMGSYLQFNIRLQCIRTGVQLRCRNKYSIRFKYSGNIHKINTNELCSVCNLHVTETLVHVLVDCPLYKHLRGRLEQQNSYNFNSIRITLFLLKQNPICRWSSLFVRCYGKFWS